MNQFAHVLTRLAEEPLDVLQHALENDRPAPLPVAIRLYQS